MGRPSSVVEKAVFTHQSVLPWPPEVVFAWHERPDAIRDLMPASTFLRIERQTGGIGNGALVVIAIGLGPLRVRWVARHDGYEPGRQFCDEQIEGPFKYWRHIHRFEPLSDGQTSMIDHVTYALRGGAFIHRALQPVVRLGLSRMFANRHRALRRALGSPSPASRGGTSGTSERGQGTAAT